MDNQSDFDTGSGWYDDYAARQKVQRIAALRLLRHVRATSSAYQALPQYVRDRLDAVLEEDERLTAELIYPERRPAGPALTAQVPQ